MVSSVSNSSSNILQMMMQSMQQRQDDMFKKIDSSGDGKIDKTEFSDLAKKLSEMSGSSINADNAFAKYDANKDGTLSKNELTSFMKDNAPAPPSGAEKSGGASKSSKSGSYDVKDTNQDGTVSVAEELAYDLTHSVSSAHGANSSDQLTQLMDMLQVNSASDSSKAGKETSSKNNYISTLLDTLKSISSNNGASS